MGEALFPLVNPHNLKGTLMDEYQSKWGPDSTGLAKSWERTEELLEQSERKESRVVAAIFLPILLFAFWAFLSTILSGVEKAKTYESQQAQQCSQR